MRVANFFGKYVLAASLAGIMVSCDDSDDVASTGQAEVKITDAAVDAENISGVYLRVNEIQAFGEGETRTIVSFDDPKVFNVMDYQNGATYDLGDGELEAGMYSELRLVLDEGSYVEFDDGSTADLTVPSGTSSGYKIKGDYQISANSTTNLVVDIDLRKAFVQTGTGEYKLRPTARLVNDENTATINGTVSANTEDRVVIYAYLEGEYEESEAAEPADGSSRFEGSVNSAVVADGEFTLAFMEPGDYELIVATYVKNETEETYDFQSAAEAEVLIDGSILDMIELEADAEVDVLINLSL